MIEIEPRAPSHLHGGGVCVCKISGVTGPYQGRYAYHVSLRSDTYRYRLDERIGSDTLRYAYRSVSARMKKNGRTGGGRHETTKSHDERACDLRSGARGEAAKRRSGEAAKQRSGEQAFHEAFQRTRSRTPTLKPRVYRTCPSRGCEAAAAAVAVPTYMLAPLTSVCDLLCPGENAGWLGLLG